jgi:hypothetical protein
MRDDVMIINPGLEARTTKSGKGRFAVRIDAEPIIINNSPKELGKPVAEAIANHFRQRIRTLAAVTSPATLRARKVAAKAFAEGKAWAMKRYAGGRIGSLPPNQTEMLFRDSGRFADSIVANASADNAWRINVAANRLDPATAGTSGVQRIWQRLVQLIPEFGNAALLMDNEILKRTIRRVAEERIKVGKVTDKGVTHIEAFAAQFLKSGT